MLLLAGDVGDDLTLEAELVALADSNTDNICMGDKRFHVGDSVTR